MCKFPAGMKFINLWIHEYTEVKKSKYFYSLIEIKEKKTKNIFNAIDLNWSRLTNLIEVIIYSVIIQCKLFRRLRLTIRPFQDQSIEKWQIEIVEYFMEMIDCEFTWSKLFKLPMGV